MTEQAMSANAQKFRELAEKRVIKAIRAIRLVGNLANKTNYSYTQDEAKKIIRAMQRELWTIKRRFVDSADPDDVSFEL